MLEVITFIGIFVTILIVKNRIECNRYSRDAEVETEKKKRARQDLLAKALERSIR